MTPKKVDEFKELEYFEKLMASGTSWTEMTIKGDFLIEVVKQAELRGIQALWDKVDYCKQGIEGIRGEVIHVKDLEGYMKKLKNEFKKT